MTRKHDEYIAARDPIGIRPLYYGYDRSGAHRIRKRAEKPRRSVRAHHAIPARTLLEGRRVRLLLRHEPKSSSICHGRHLKRYAKTYAKSSSAGVEKRLVADAKVGFLLSGGLDSSLVCAIAARESEKPDTHLCDRYERATLSTSNTQNRSPTISAATTPRSS